MHRFYAPPENFKDGYVDLGAEETRHMRDVLRLRSGDNVLVFDGSGHEFSCRIEDIGKKAASISVEMEVFPLSPESPLRLTLAAALLKGDKFDLVVQKAVELGVSCLVPLKTDRCEARFVDAPKRLERWRRIVLEAAKQSGRATLMEMSDPAEFTDLISRSSAESTVLFSERNGDRMSGIRSSAGMTAVVGPEGGWDDEELDAAAAAGVRIITLGGRILRAETAAIAITAILQNRFGDMN